MQTRVGGRPREDPGGDGVRTPRTEAWGHTSPAHACTSGPRPQDAGQSQSAMGAPRRGVGESRPATSQGPIASSPLHLLALFSLLKPHVSASVLSQGRLAPPQELTSLPHPLADLPLTSFRKLFLFASMEAPRSSLLAPQEHDRPKTF